MRATCELSGLLMATLTVVAGCDVHQLFAPSDGATDGTEIGPRNDAGPAADAAPDAGTLAGHLVYPEGAIHSPITSDVVASMHAIAAQGAQQDNVFAKVGDSITASTSFLVCLGTSTTTDLGAHTELSTSVSYFRGGNAAGTSPFSRSSVTAVGGWTAADPLTGSPPPLDREVEAIDPRFAVVMYGTNDDRYGRTLDAYGSDMWTIVDRLRALGVVPILSTIPAIHGDPGSNARVPLFNGVVRALAQGRAVPLVDLHLALSALPDEGISSDGLHPTVSPDGACVLTASGLQYGYNERNLITLQALDRARVARSGTALDSSAPRRTGTGSHAAPFIATLPIADMADTRMGDATFATYSSCGGLGGGHEIVYRLDLAQQQTIDAYVIDRGAVDVDIEILAGTLSPGACVASGDQSASATVGPGTVYLVVDSRADTTEGEFVLVVEAR